METLLLYIWLLSSGNKNILKSFFFFRNRRKHAIENKQQRKLDCIENIYENTLNSPKYNKAMENCEYQELGEFSQRSLYDKLD